MSALHERVHPPISSAFAHDVLDGLAHRQRRIAGRWLYDRPGSLLFEAAAQQPEYYPARIERAILEQVAGPIADAAGPNATLVELGSSPSRATATLLGALQDPAAYVPVDIGEAFHGPAVQAIADRFPHLTILPWTADAAHLASLPPGTPAGRRVVFFPGSTIGHFDPDTAESLLARLARTAGAGALLVIGVDHTRDPARMVRACDDAAGAMAAFNRHLLLRINRELQADFDAGGFRHAVRFNPEQRRVEMHLVGVRTQRATVLGRAFDFAIGESILTGSSYKPSPFQFLAMAHRAGWRQEQLWVEGAAGYAVHVLQSVSAS